MKPAKNAWVTMTYHDRLGNRVTKALRKTKNDATVSKYFITKLKPGATTLRGRSCNYPKVMPTLEDRTTAKSRTTSTKTLVPSSFSIIFYMFSNKIGETQ